MSYETKLEALREDARFLNEKNDCTVKACAVVTGYAYKDLHLLMQAEGRQPGKGVTRLTYQRMLVKLGFEIKLIWAKESDHSQYDMSGLTMRTVEPTLQHYFPNRKFLVSTRDHVAGFDGQDLVDWTNGRQHRVLDIYEVI